MRLDRLLDKSNFFGIICMVKRASSEKDIQQIGKGNSLVPL